MVYLVMIKKKLDNDYCIFGYSCQRAPLLHAHSFFDWREDVRACYHTARLRIVGANKVFMV